MKPTVRDHRIQAYYSIPFDIEITTAPMSVWTLRDPHHLRSLETDGKQTNRVLALVRQPLCAGRFDEAYLRLILIVDKREEFLVDTEGRVQSRNKSYDMTPGNFLRLRNFVQALPLGQ